jgi:uncharacterized protein (TIGR03435 family)
MAVAMPRRLLVTIAAVMATAVPRIAAQTFEVASIKRSAIPSGPAIALERMFRTADYRPLNGRFSLTGAHALTLILQAYDLKEFQVQGAPAWLASERYDIDAIAGDATVEQTRGMLRALLEDRFRLQVRRESRIMEVYELSPARGGLKLTAAKDGDCVSFDFRSSAPPPPIGTVLCGGFVRRIVNGAPDRIDRLEAAGVALSALVTVLEHETDRRIVDRTGATGTFTVKLEFAPNVAAFDTGPPISAPSATAAPGLSIFTALQEQLGLRLATTRAPVDVLVIERVERPTPN